MHKTHRSLAYGIGNIEGLSANESINMTYANTLLDSFWEGIEQCCSEISNVHETLSNIETLNE